MYMGGIGIIADMGSLALPDPTSKIGIVNVHV